MSNSNSVISNNGMSNE